MNKLKLHLLASAAVLATALSGPASAVTWSGNDGWEVSYTGFVNLFYNQLKFDYTENHPTKANTSEDTALLNEGLLPSFHTMKAKSPTVNGLTGTSQITFAIDTSTDKGVNLNKANPSASGTGDGLIDLREVFFNVEGSFGTLSVGRTLALFQRQAILKDMTLFGVGAVAGPDANGTALGRIGIGYVYPDFRARFAWISNEVNGFQASLGVFQPRETGFSERTGFVMEADPADATMQQVKVAGSGTAFYAKATGTGALETSIPQFQGELTYNSSFEGGSVGFWGGFQWQEAELRDGNGDFETVGWNFGIDASLQGFNVVGSYYGGSGLGTLFTQSSIACQVIVMGADAAAVRTAAVTPTYTCGEADNTGGYIQTTYTFNGKTKVGASWGYSEQEAEASIGLGEITNEGWTVGLYHDVNPWLKVIAEYNAYDVEALGNEVDGFSLGAFMFW